MEKGSLLFVESPNFFFSVGLQIFLYQRLAGLMILGEEERLLTGWKKSASEESWTRDWGGGKSSVPFPRYPLVGLPLSLHSPFFPNKNPGPRSKKFLQLHPWGREVEKRRAFSKEKPQKTKFVKLIYISVKKRIYSNLVVTIIFTFSSFLSKVSILLSENSLICSGFMSGQVIRALSILKRPLCY